MAKKKTLRNTLRTSGGQLAETSTEELSAQAGRDIQPLTPQESSVLGANQDQAKMVGSSAQKASALRQAISPEDDLDTVRRRQQVRREATAEESQKAEEASKLAGLSGMSGRVDELVKKKFSKMEQPAGAGLLIDTGNPEIDVLLDNIAKNPNDLESIKQLNTLRGREATSVMNATEILDEFGITKDETTGELSGEGVRGQVAGAVAGAIGDEQVTLSDLSEGQHLDVMFQDMGFGSTQEVAELLGLDAAKMGQMSVEEIQQSVDAAIAEEFDTVSDLEAQLNDPALGPAEKAEIRSQLREMGAVGVRSAETDAEQMAQSLQDAETVEFLGEEIDVNELLSNDYVSGIVKNYFDNPEDRAKIEEQYPELASYIEENKSMLKEAADSIESAVGEFASIQQQNLALQDTKHGPIPDDLMENLMPGFSDMSTEVKQPPAVVEMMQQDPKVYDAITQLNDKVGPEILAGLNGLSAQEINQLGLNDSNSPQYKSVENYYTMAKSLADINPENRDQVASLFGASSEQEFNQTAAEAERRARSGMFGEDPNRDKLSEIIAPGQTLTDAANNLKDVYLSDGKLKTPAELLQGMPTDYKSTYNNMASFTKQDNKVYEMAKDAFINDDKVDDSEALSIIKDKDTSDLSTLWSSPEFKDKLSLTMQDKMVKKYNHLLLPEYNALVSAASGGKISGIKDLKSSLKSSTPKEFKKIKDSAFRTVEGINKQLSDPKIDPLRAKTLRQQLNSITSILNSRDTQLKGKEGKSKEAIDLDIMGKTGTSILDVPNTIVESRGPTISSGIGPVKSEKETLSTIPGFTNLKVPKRKKKRNKAAETIKKGQKVKDITDKKKLSKKQGSKDEFISLEEALARR